jgi:hypothetical protein
MRCKKVFHSQYSILAIIHYSKYSQPLVLTCWKAVVTELHVHRSISQAPALHFRCGWPAGNFFHLPLVSCGPLFMCNDITVPNEKRLVYSSPLPCLSVSDQISVSLEIHIHRYVCTDCEFRAGHNAGEERYSNYDRLQYRRMFIPTVWDYDTLTQCKVHTVQNTTNCYNVS